MAKDQILFRVQCFVPHDKLGMVLWLLSGKAYDVTQQPVTNARVTNSGQLVAKTEAGSSVELFEKHLRANPHIREINSGMGREFCRSIGRAEGSYSAIFTAAQKARLIKHVGKGKTSRFVVLINQPAKRKSKAKSAPKKETAAQ